MIPPASVRELRSCGECAFFVYLTDSGDARCNLAKGERENSDRPRWDRDDNNPLYDWPCMYNLKPREIEEAQDQWIQNLANESLRFYNSAHNRRKITGSKSTRRRRF